MRRAWLLMLLPLWMGEATAATEKCLLLYSYHPGYEWNDGIDRGATEALQGGVTLQPHFVETFDEWKQAYRKVQERNVLLVLSNNAGVSHWDQQKAEQWVKQHSQSFALTTNPWMSQLSHITMGKVAEEQGAWAGQKALAILQGADIGSIAMTTNKQWKLTINESLLKKN